MKGIRSLVLSVAAAALVAGGLVSPGAAWADVPTTVPTITSPVDWSTVSGVVDITVSSSAPRVRLSVTGDTQYYASPVSGVATFPWATWGRAEYIVAQVTASDCDETDQCSAVGAVINLSIHNLHPYITSQLPDPFGPNGNGVKDTTTTTYLVDEPMDVWWTALDGTGTVIRGPIALGSKAAGTYSYTWDGKDAGGASVPDGTYTVRISAQSGATQGRAQTTVALDATAPTMAPVVGAGLAFYPYPDGYKDSYMPTVLLTEPATLTLTVRTSTNALVRRLAATKAAGRVGIAWNGRNASGALVPAGTYRWTLVAVDAAGNVRATPVYTTIVSRKKLVAKTVYVTLTPNKRSATKRSSTCAAVRTSTYGSTGAWLYNNCDIRRTGQEYVEAWFSTALPAAISYSTLTLQVFGHTHSHAGLPAVSRAYGWIDRVGGATWVSKSVDFRATTARWVSVVAAPGSGFVSSTRRVAFGFGVGNYWYPAPNEVDVRYLRLVVVLKVLV